MSDPQGKPSTKGVSTSEKGASLVPLVDYLVIDDGVDHAHLRAKECSSCGALYFERRNACARCGGSDFGTKDLSTTGTLRSFTIVQRAAPGVPVPYVSTVVELDGGGVVKANLLGQNPDPQSIKLGMPVRLVTFVCGEDASGQQAVAFGFSAL